MGPDVELQQRNLWDPVIPASVAVTGGLDAQLVHRAQKADPAAGCVHSVGPQQSLLGQETKTGMWCVCGGLAHMVNASVFFSAPNAVPPKHTHTYTLYHSASSVFVVPSSAAQMLQLLISQ